MTHQERKLKYFTEEVTTEFTIKKNTNFGIV